jgi:hypothetical protein
MNDDFFEYWRQCYYNLMGGPGGANLCNFAFTVTTWALIQKKNPVFKRHEPLRDSE